MYMFVIYCCIGISGKTSAIQLGNFDNNFYQITMFIDTIPWSYLDKLFVIMYTYIRK